MTATDKAWGDYQAATLKCCEAETIVRGILGWQRDAEHKHSEARKSFELAKHAAKEVDLPDSQQVDIELAEKALEAADAEVANRYAVACTARKLWKEAREAMDKARRTATADCYRTLRQRSDTETND